MTTQKQTTPQNQNATFAIFMILACAAVSIIVIGYQWDQIPGSYKQTDYNAEITENIVNPCIEDLLMESFVDKDTLQRIAKEQNKELLDQATRITIAAVEGMDYEARMEMYKIYEEFCIMASKL